MVDLSLDFCGLELKNPLIVASSDAMRDIRQIKQAEECGAAAVIIKGMMPPDSVGLSWLLRFYLDVETQTVCGIAGGKMLSYDQGIELIKTAKKDTKIKIGANIPFFGLNELEGIVNVAKKAANAGADFIEMNFSPQVSGHAGSHLKVGEFQQDTDVDILKATMEEFPKWILEGVKATKQAVDIPIVAKICPEGIDIVSIAKVMENSGADALDAINIGGGSFKIDIFNEGKLIMPGARNAVFATAGDPLKTFAQGIVARISRDVKIPIIGTGGLMDWKDVIEMMMFGATAVSFCTLLLIHGFQAITEIEKGIREFMEMQGYKSLEDFRGLALKNIAPSAHAFDFIPSVARVDEQMCTGCGICLRPAHCLAISIINDRAIINEKECLGCGTCSFLCPAHAISIVEIAG
jgi:dihydroorotate dehydrogenase/NAD-dependent dihydropyrimidine dehydrogenase PreA subunit